MQMTQYGLYLFANPVSRQGSMGMLVKGKRVLFLDSGKHAYEVADLLRRGAKEILCVNGKGELRRIQRIVCPGGFRSSSVSMHKGKTLEHSFDAALARLRIGDQTSFESICEKCGSWLVPGGELLLHVEHGADAEQGPHQRLRTSSYVNRLLLYGFEIRRLDEDENFESFTALACKQ